MGIQINKAIMENMIEISQRHQRKHNKTTTNKKQKKQDRITVVSSYLTSEYEYVIKLDSCEDIDWL